MAHDVFISYSSKDKTTADAVCATLESRGIRCWIAPRDVLPGEEYAAALVSAVRESRLMVLVFSSGSNQSPQVLREVERAVSKGLPILPLRIEDIPPSAAMEYYISSRHWLDALTAPLEQHLVHLADTVKLLLSRMPEAPVPVPPAEAVKPVPPVAPATAPAPPATQSGPDTHAGPDTQPGPHTHPVPDTLPTSAARSPPAAARRAGSPAIMRTVIWVMLSGAVVGLAIWGLRTLAANRRHDAAEHEVSERYKEMIYTPHVTCSDSSANFQKSDAAIPAATELSYGSQLLASGNCEAAKYWIHKAAEDGSAVAQDELGDWLLSGFEHIPLPAENSLLHLNDGNLEALRWYRKAAEQGYVPAQFSLGEHGNLGRMEPAERADWFRKAAEGGNNNAQFFLGLAYAKGDGVAQDDVSAYMWMSIAGTRGQSMEASRSELEGRMSSAQLAEAKQRADEWMKAHPDDRFTPAPAN